MPRGTEIPSREISPANHYSKQHRPYPLNEDKFLSLNTRWAVTLSESWIK